MKLFTVLSGFFALDGGGVFGGVPKPLWMKIKNADEENKIKMSLRHLVIKGEGFNLICDAGFGTQKEKVRNIYNIEDEEENLKKNLAEIGLKPDDITDVVISHLHIDHAGGLISEKTDAFFPNAVIHIHSENMKTASFPNEREKSSYRRDIINGIKENYRLNLIESSDYIEIHPGVHLKGTFGHTRGMLILKVFLKKDNRAVIYPADLVPSSWHLHLPFITGYDMNAEKLLEEKRELLKEIYEKNYILIFDHDPVYNGVTLKLNKKQRYEIAEQVEFPLEA